VVQPRYRHNPEPLTRWTQMLAAPARDGRVFQRIFAEHGEPFQRAHPRYQTAYDADLGAKRREGGNPETRGDLACRCVQCGPGTPVVAMRGTSSVCWRWAQVSGDHWGSQGSRVRHAGGISRHSIRTVPALCRTPFSQKAADGWSAFRRGGAPCLAAVSRTVRGQARRGGASTVLHTQGRQGPSHPPRPVLATRGGDAAPGERWAPRQDVPYDLRRRQGPWPLLTLVRQPRNTAPSNPWVEACFQQDPAGLVPNVPKGRVPAPSQSGARSVAQDVGSPPLAVRRLERDEGQRVTSPYRSPRTERVEPETVAVDTWIGRMVPHPMPKGCKRLRSDGVQATQPGAKVKGVLRAALAKVAGVVKGAVKSIARLTYRQRDAPSPGRDPCICPHGGPEMGVWCIWHPTYGVSHDEGEGIKRGTYAASAQRAGP
jgi:hypothetical protein